MRRKAHRCPWQGTSDSWRVIWKVPDAAESLYVVRQKDQRACEIPLDPGEVLPLIDGWAAEPNGLSQLLVLYEALQAPRLGPKISPEIVQKSLKPRLREAFRRGELLLIRTPPALAGAGAIEALLAPAPGKTALAAKKKEPVERLLLQILRVDDHFVPKTEKLDIVYELEGFSGKSVRLDIESKHYGVVFSKDLEGPEKTDGVHTFYWDGKRTSPADRYAHPLLSPFRVHLYHNATYTDERNFKILYHSIVLKNGPWTPDEKEPPESDEKAWSAYKLNQLGYYGGPVGTDLDDYLKKAIIRYKANHKKLREKYYPNYNDTITPALKAALKAKDDDRKFPIPAATENPGAKSVLNVEALTYERTGPGADEFGGKRSTYEKDRLNRPLAPVEVEIWLKKKDNSKVFQPEAVGPCRIDWRFTDSDEDLSPQYAKTASEPSMTKTFIEKALKLKSGRTGTNGDDCHKDFAGIREDPATNWRTPFQTGDAYVPYSVKEDGGNKVVYTIACEDKAKYPKRQGKAGVFFRPSYIAGDDYKLSAEIDFTGQANKDELEKLHGITSPAKKIKAETGTYTVRRFGKVAMSIDWPARKNAYEWDKIAADFGKAFNDIDTKGIVTKKIGHVLTEKQYKDIVTANTAHTDPSKIGYYADYLVGVKLPNQGNLNADDYKTALKTYCHTDYNDKIQTPLGAQISENLRKEHPSGFIIVNFLLHRPVNIKNDPANGDNKVTKANKGFITWGGSIGLADSVILADQKDPDKVYYVVSHEMGHNFYLLHWENTGENNQNNHDQDDHNCTMSYSDFSFADAGHYAFQEPGVYTPHFCGKCNLALRGWDIVAGGMVVKAIKGVAKKPIVTPSVKVAQDAVVVGGARQKVTVKVDRSFNGTGTLTCASNAVKFFTAAKGGSEVGLSGSGKTYTGAQLKSGQVLYVEARSASGSTGDIAITLKLTKGGDGQDVAEASTAKITAVKATLQLYDKTGVLMSDTDKLAPGRAVYKREATNQNKRAKLIVGALQPADFKRTLVLKAKDSKVRVFDKQQPADKDKPLSLPLKIAAKDTPRELWVEGTKKGSGSGFTLDIQGLQEKADAVTVTIEELVPPDLEVEKIVFSGTGMHTVNKDMTGNFDPWWVSTTAAADQSPLCYTRNQKIKVTVEFKVKQKPSENRTVKIRATAKAGTKKLEWLAANPVAVPTTATTVTLPATESNVEIPNEVACYDPLKLTWEMTQPDGSWKKIGETTNVLYATLADPAGGVTAYWTPLDISCRAAAGAKGNDAFVSKVFAPFKTHVGDGKGMKRKRDGVRLSYYRDGYGTVNRQYTWEMLHYPDGTARCGGWARFVIDIYLLHGITTAHIIQVVPIPTPGIAFLVKNCQFNGPGTLAAPFTHAGTTGCVKLDGLVGQGKTNPQFLFGDHALVTYAGKIYDPSYGTGPFASRKAWEKAALAGLGRGGLVPFTQADGTFQRITAECSKGFIIHTLTAGQTLTSVAALYGTTASALYNHAYNATLRAARATVAAVTVGDAVYIPRQIASIEMLRIAMVI